jgi:hypothetical protein
MDETIEFRRGQPRSHISAITFENKGLQLFGESFR